MKSRFFSGLKFLTVLGGATVLLGCGNSATKVMAQNEPDPIDQEIAATSQVTTNALTKSSVAVPENLSPGLSEIIKLSQSNVSEEVLLAYIANSDLPINPSADEILYLTDLGLSDKVITAVVTRKNSNVAATTSPQENVATNVSPINQPPPASAQIPVRQPAPVAAPAQPVVVNNFYESLSPYGNWVEVADYGLCWQPAVVAVNADWRPYCDRGRWIYTDCGWYWQSDYSWGWAPFHYGRWHRDYRCGWVWSPDTTWGPSWVSWRYSSDYCGWAPLPPAACYRSGFGFSFYDQNVGVSFEFGLRDDCYTFVPSRHFYDRAPSQYVVSQSYNKTVYNNTTVNNYYANNNNTVVNHGIAPERIAAATGAKIQKVAVRETPLTATGSVAAKPDRVAQVGNNLVVYRPPASATSSSPTPTSINAPASKIGKTSTYSLAQNNVTPNLIPNNNVPKHGLVERPTASPARPSQPLTIRQAAGPIFSPNIAAQTKTATHPEAKNEIKNQSIPTAKLDQGRPLPPKVSTTLDQRFLKNSAQATGQRLENSGLKNSAPVPVVQPATVPRPVSPSVVNSQAAPAAAPKQNERPNNLFSNQRQQNASQQNQNQNVTANVSATQRSLPPVSVTHHQEAQIQQAPRRAEPSPVISTPNYSSQAVQIPHRAEQPVPQIYRSEPTPRVQAQQNYSAPQYSAPQIHAAPQVQIHAAPPAQIHAAPPAAVQEQRQLPRSVADRLPDGKVKDELQKIR